MAESCSTEDLTAPTFVNCPARDIVVNTKQTSADNVARWVELRAVSDPMALAWIRACMMLQLSPDAIRRGDRVCRTAPGHTSEGSHKSSPYSFVCL